MTTTEARSGTALLTAADLLRLDGRGVRGELSELFGPDPEPPAE